jgi:tRNA threonylcarbamoyladenosine biosynthesis protein TsaE
MLGREIGSRLRAGAIVGLVGEMGCGKTVFVKGLAMGLGADPGRVTSPTFTLVNEYRGRVPLYHFDQYRLGDESELDSIDYRSYLGGGVCAVEWFERFPGAWPAGSIIVRFERLSARKRRITISGPKSLVSEIPHA